jgi:hypothetical protein
MTNKLVVIINILKYKLQLPPEPLTRGLPPTDPRSLSSTQFVEPPRKKIPVYATENNIQTVRIESLDTRSLLLSSEN